MAETKPSRILEVSSNMENNEQQYVEIGSNIYLGTKDGIKYNLIQASDNKFRLVEAPSDSSTSLSDSSGSDATSPLYESSDKSDIKWSEPSGELKKIQIVSVKAEPSPCKGQGDEIGNSVISPRTITSSLHKAECVAVGNTKQALTADNLNTSSIFTYTTLYPKQEEGQIVSVKAEPSPCKGQGDEIGNAVISPRTITSSLHKAECVAVGNIKQTLTAENLNASSILTYTTLYPKQEEGQVMTYFVSPNSSCGSYSPIFPSPRAIQPARSGRKSRMPFMPPGSPYTPIPKVRRGAPRMRRPRQPVYQYTPQFLHSTPTNLSSTKFGGDSSLSLTSCSSSSLSGSSLITPDSSIEYPRVPNNTPDNVSAETESLTNQKVLQVLPLEWSSYIENYMSLNPREAHNEKERLRRLRIKNACQSMREFMPWLDEKTENARIFEEAVNFIAYVKGIVGHESNLGFMKQNLPF